MEDMNRILIKLLTYKLNEEMKNISKRVLTKQLERDIMDLSNEREVSKNG